MNKKNIKIDVSLGEGFLSNRKLRMIEMRTKYGFTLGEISDYYGLSRQRVSQILQGIDRPKKEFYFICRTCGKKNFYKAYKKWVGKSRASYCNKECQKKRHLKYGISPTANPKEYTRMQSKVRYANPVTRAIIKKNFNKYYKKVMADPLKRKKRAEMAIEGYRRRCQDPEYREKLREYARKRYHLILTDPEKRKVQGERYKEVQRKYYQKRKKNGYKRLTAGSWPK